MDKVRRAGKKRKPMSDINVVPYIDVMLVLLIIFMVTAPMLMQGVEVDLPQASSAPVDTKVEPLIVSVKKDGSYYINLGDEKETVVSLQDVTEKVAKILKRKPETPIMVWGDTNVDYGSVIELMAGLQGAGAGAVGLVTENPL
ncbi:MAG: protein TolR [Pseudomonadales bacterium]